MSAPVIPSESTPAQGEPLAIEGIAEGMSSKIELVEGPPNSGADIAALCREYAGWPNTGSPPLDGGELQVTIVGWPNT